MSAAAVYEEVRRAVAADAAESVAADVLYAVLAAVDPWPLAVLAAAGADARVPADLARQRAAGIFLNLAASQLADDLARDACGYLAEPARVGPCAQFALLNLSFARLADAGVPAAVLIDAACEIQGAAGHCHAEDLAAGHTAVPYLHAVEDVAGRRWDGYLRVLWAGTPLASRAVDVGRALGAVTAIVRAVERDDARLRALERDARAHVLAWARATVDALRAEGLPCLEPVLQRLGPALAAEA